MPRLLTSIWTAAAIAAVVLTGIVPNPTMAGETTSKTHIVQIHRFQFSPSELVVATGDTVIWINNDLVPDIYLANIGFTKGIDVVSNIFGDAMQEAGRQFCDSGESILEKATCYKLLHLVTLLNPEKQDISERCTLLASGKETRDCMVTRMALLAARKNDESLCERISKGHDMGYHLCKKLFQGRDPGFRQRGGDTAPIHVQRSASRREGVSV